MTVHVPAWFGARPDDGGAEFTLWAPGADAVELAIDRAGRSTVTTRLTQTDDGLWTASVDGAAAGDRYRLRRDDRPFWPDPASRSQPEGVHGPSEVVDPDAFAWTDSEWSRPDRSLVIYELHVGTFTPDGTFDGVVSRLPYLRDLGITAIELMPIAEFPGRWNWGYDGAALFAPCHRYGRPDDLRRLVDRAHAFGLAVLIDVVYNHLGPDGAYLAAFAPGVIRGDRDSPWGGGLDVEPTTGARLRQFFIANAVHWVREYHADGLRLDATHAIVERGDQTFVAELTDAVRAAVPQRQVLIVAEDDRNLSAIVRPRGEGGWGLDAVWADDFHHQVHVLTTGERDGYFSDFSGTTADLATTVREGWFYRGAYAPYFGGPRGSETAGIPRDRFVICLQNHDQIGNRARGDRLHHLIGLDTYAAASTLWLLAPETPLLFMGQEWAALTPFQYFTDHAEPLASQVVEGRRREFRAFASFGDGEAAAAIPSPQDAATFERSGLRWDELDRDPHDQMVAVYRALLQLRQDMHASGVSLASVDAPDDWTVVLHHQDRQGQPSHLTIVRLGGRDPLPDSPERLAPFRSIGAPTDGWTIVFETQTVLMARPTRPASLGELPDRVDGPGAIVLARRAGGASR
jgi:maltooligosyltrehalose trehalohydrolase